MNQRPIPVTLEFQLSPDQVIGQFKDGIITFFANKVTRELMPVLGYRIVETEMVDGVEYIRKMEVTTIGMTMMSE